MTWSCMTPLRGLGVAMVHLAKQATDMFSLALEQSKLVFTLIFRDRYMAEQVYMLHLGVNTLFHIYIKNFDLAWCLTLVIYIIGCYYRIVTSGQMVLIAKTLAYAH